MAYPSVHNGRGNITINLITFIITELIKLTHTSELNPTALVSIIPIKPYLLAVINAITVILVTLDLFHNSFGSIILSPKLLEDIHYLVLTITSFLSRRPYAIIVNMLTI